MVSRGGSRPMDPVKTAVAEAFQKGILPIPSADQRRDLGVVDVEVQIIKPTETIIRIKTRSHGTRYFHNVLREMM